MAQDSNSQTELNYNHSHYVCKLARCGPANFASDTLTPTLSLGERGIMGSSEKGYQG
jgi:hypothetical protein